MIQEAADTATPQVAINVLEVGDLVFSGEMILYELVCPLLTHSVLSGV